MQPKKIKLSKTTQALIEGELSELFYGMVYGSTTAARRKSALDFIEEFTQLIASETVRQLQNNESK